jgi:hypothetical protein
MRRRVDAGPADRVVIADRRLRPAVSRARRSPRSASSCAPAPELFTKRASTSPARTVPAKNATGSRRAKSETVFTRSPTLRSRRSRDMRSAPAAAWCTARATIGVCSSSWPAASCAARAIAPRASAPTPFCCSTIPRTRSPALDASSPVSAFTCSTAAPAWSRRSCIVRVAASWTCRMSSETLRIGSFSARRLVSSVSNVMSVSSPRMEPKRLAAP